MKVLDFHSERMKKMGKTGEANFICCPKCQSEEWAVGVMSDGENPFIYALVCVGMKEASCDHVLTVEGGVISDEVIA